MLTEDAPTSRTIEDVIGSDNNDDDGQTKKRVRTTDEVGEQAREEPTEDVDTGDAYDGTNYDDVDDAVDDDDDYDEDEDEDDDDDYAVNPVNLDPNYDDSQNGYLNTFMDLNDFYTEMADVVPSFEINNIRFITRGILFKYTHDTEEYYNNDYDKVGMISIAPDRRRRFFWVYQSKSELGMWRLCGCIDQQPYIYDKLSHKIEGFGDYVQSTLLNIQLQIYINTNVDKYRTYPGFKLDYNTEGKDKPLYGLTRFTYEKEIEPSNPEDNTPSTFVTVKTTNCSVFSQDFMDVLNVENREIHAYPFNMFDNKKQCGDVVPQNIMDQFSRVFENEYDYDDPIIIYGNYTNRNFTRNPNSHVTDVSVSGDIKECYMYRKTQITDPTLPEYQTNKIKLIFLQTTSIGCYRNRDDLTRTNPYNIVNIGENVTCTGLPISDKPYFMPIALIPIIEGGTMCNVYGTYPKYIRAGSYVCKMFEYYFQCRENEQQRFLCLDAYNFIGDRYSNLFPFLNISLDLLKPRRRRRYAAPPSLAPSSYSSSSLSIPAPPSLAPSYSSSSSSLSIPAPPSLAPSSSLSLSIPAPPSLAPSHSSSSSSSLSIPAPPSLAPSSYSSSSLSIPAPPSLAPSSYSSSSLSIPAPPSLAPSYTIKGGIRRKRETRKARGTRRPRGKKRTKRIAHKHVKKSRKTKRNRRQHRRTLRGGVPCNC
jgi:hypothetical protein